MKKTNAKIIFAEHNTTCDELLDIFSHELQINEW